MMEENASQNTTQRELPRYKCHKEVWALKIAELKLDADGGNILIPADEGYAPFKLEPGYFRKHTPEPGGYYVVYSDGYKSFSPAEAFEGGYKRI